MLHCLAGGMHWLLASDVHVLAWLANKLFKRMGLLLQQHGCTAVQTVLWLQPPQQSHVAWRSPPQRNTYSTQHLAMIEQHCTVDRRRVQTLLSVVWCGV
jgi:hypothetical protein